MAFKKRTLRTMSPTARKVARLIGEQESIAKRLKNLIPDLQRLDLDSRALDTAKQTSPVWLDVQDLTSSLEYWLKEFNFEVTPENLSKLWNDIMANELPEACKSSLTHNPELRVES